MALASSVWMFAGSPAGVSWGWECAGVLFLLMDILPAYAGSSGEN